MTYIGVQTSTAHKKIGTDKESWEGTFKICGAEDEEAILELFSKFERTIMKSTGQTYIKYTHKDSEPDDALQACNFAYIGWDILRNSGERRIVDIDTESGYEDSFYN